MGDNFPRGWGHIWMYDSMMSTTFSPRMSSRGISLPSEQVQGFGHSFFRTFDFGAVKRIAKKKKKKRERENEEEGPCQTLFTQLCLKWGYIMYSKGKTDHLDFPVCRRSSTFPLLPRPDIQECTVEMRRLRMNIAQWNCGLYPIQTAIGGQQWCR